MDLEKKDHINPQPANHQKLYGLAKIHKVQVTPHPIVPYVNSLNTHLTKNVSTLLSQPGGHTSSCSYGEEYTGETKRTFVTHVKEHLTATRIGETDKSA